MDWLKDPWAFWLLVTVLGACTIAILALLALVAITVFA